MEELIDKKEVLAQIKSIPCSTTKEVFFMHTAISRIRKIPTVEGFDAEKYEKLVLADMERKHSENQQLLSELKAVLPTTTEAETMAKAYDRFAEKLKVKFVDFRKNTDIITLGTCISLINSVAEQLKEEQ